MFPFQLTSCFHFVLSMAFGVDNAAVICPFMSQAYQVKFQIMFCGFISFSFDPYLMLVFTEVVKKIKEFKLTICNKRSLNYIQQILAGNSAAACSSNPMFDPLFESEKCRLIFNTVI